MANDHGSRNGSRPFLAIFCFGAGIYGIYVVASNQGPTSPAAYIAIPCVILLGILSLARTKRSSNQRPKR